jgi:transcriptional regulator with XRE-family HTH domain
MFFGDEHLGRAVTFLRENLGIEQQELAEKLDLKPGTLSQYESGKRGMNEAMVGRVAGALGLNPLEIWNTAYRIFQYNFFREWAKREGTTVEELIDRTTTRPSLERILEVYSSRVELDRQLIALKYGLAVSLGRTGLDGANLLKVVVEPHPRKARKKAAREKATRFDQNRKTEKASQRPDS